MSNSESSITICTQQFKFKPAANTQIASFHLEASFGYQGILTSARSDQGHLAPHVIVPNSSYGLPDHYPMEFDDLSTLLRRTKLRIHT